MFIPTLIMGALAAIFLFVGYHKGQGQHIAGIRLALNMVLEILPLLIFAFILAGMIQVLVPRRANIEVGRGRLGHSRNIHRYGGRCLCPWRSVCQFTYCRRTSSLRRRCRDYGCVFNRLVIVGS